MDRPSFVQEDAWAEGQWADVLFHENTTVSAFVRVVDALCVQGRSSRRQLVESGEASEEAPATRLWLMLLDASSVTARGTSTTTTKGERM